MMNKTRLLIRMYETIELLEHLRKNNRNDLKQFVLKFVASSKEYAIMKNIPVNEYDAQLKELTKYAKIRRRWRGPRCGNIHHTIRENATSISVYLNDCWLKEQK